MCFNFECSFINFLSALQGLNRAGKPSYSDSDQKEGVLFLYKMIIYVVLFSP